MLAKKCDSKYRFLFQKGGSKLTFNHLWKSSFCPKRTHFSLQLFYKLIDHKIWPFYKTNSLKVKTSNSN